jgi:hypothetical protein
MRLVLIVKNSKTSQRYVLLAVFAVLFYRQNGNSLICYILGVLGLRTSVY